MSAEFCDTNILVYAHDLSAGPKRDRALQLVEHLWAEGTATLSIQVLQEFFYTVTRKLARPLPFEQARDAAAGLAEWRVVEPTRHDVLAAVDACARWQVSFWDAMLLTTARKAGAAVVWSEDLNHGQTYDGVSVRNPFIDPPSLAGPSAGATGQPPGAPSGGPSGEPAGDQA
jgi:predicted nucleic acid-binding protein